MKDACHDLVPHECSIHTLAGPPFRHLPRPSRLHVSVHGSSIQDASNSAVAQQMPEQLEYNCNFQLAVAPLHEQYKHARYHAWQRHCCGAYFKVCCWLCVSPIDIDRAEVERIAVRLIRDEAVSVRHMTIQACTKTFQ